jgi:hypothetical protein
MSVERGRNQLTLGASASQRARLPGLPPIPQGVDAATRAFLEAVKEHLEVRGGARSNPYERAVTVRDLQEVGLAGQVLIGGARGQSGLVMVDDAGRFGPMTPDDFAKTIRDLQLYKDLLKKLDDPTRFDGLPEEVRELLLKDIALEAATRGAAVERIEKILQSETSSLAILVEEVTAAVAGAQAGVRQLEFATAQAGRAVSGQVTQVRARLDDFGGLGASVEQTLLATADAVEGFKAEYFLKVQAGNKLAGFGLSAVEDPDGNSSSAFIVLADKFAIVTNSDAITDPDNPPPNRIPFGVDASGVYINGQLRVSSGGPTLSDVKDDAKRRGSVTRVITGSAWNDAQATAAVAASLEAPNSTTTLRIGDTVTIRNNAGFAQARYWDGSAWVLPGTTIDGNLLVTGSVAASKINTYGLQVQDQFGNVILGAGTSLPVGFIQGLGALATQNAATIGQTVKLPNGAVLGVNDFVNMLSRIDASNIGLFMANAAIGSAYIGNAAVQTLNIAGNAVTVPAVGGSSGSDPSVAIYMDAPGVVFVTASVNYLASAGADATISTFINSSGGSGGYMGISLPGGFSGSITTACAFSVGAGVFSASTSSSFPGNYTLGTGTIMAIGAKR